MTFTKSCLFRLPAVTLISLVFAGSIADAQIKVTEPDWEASGENIEIIEMTVSPATAPDPIFTHRLTTLPEETIGGNAATTYMNSFSDSFLRSKWRKVEKEFGDDVQSWSGYATPRDQIQLDKLKRASSEFDDFIQFHIDRATRQRDCDWGLGLEELRGPMVIGITLGNLQETRSISRAIALQTKLAILESRFDDAIDLMRMNYRLGENVGRVKLLVGNLVAIAEVGISNGSMVDFIAAPDSPNMYWALTELPRPMVDLRGALRMVCGMAMRIFPEMATAETENHSVEEWSRIVRAIPGAAMELTRSPKPPGLEFVPAAIGVMSYAPAKQRLVDSGMDAAKVEQMAVGQVLLIDASREYRRIANVMEKEAYLPYSPKRTEAIETFLMESERSAFDSFGKIIAGMILPAIQQVRSAEMRTQRDIDALRVIEALRMHAASTGKFPMKLSDVKVVEAPANPATGKPFEYRLDGETAVLELPRSDGIVYSKRYVISLRQD